MIDLTDHNIIQAINERPRLKRAFHKMGIEDRRELVRQTHLEIADLESFNVKVFGRIKRRIEREKETS